MSIASAVLRPPPTPDEDRRLPYVRWIVLLGILLAELTALTLRFDLESLRTESGGWAAWLGQSSLVARLAVAIAAAVELLAGGRLHAELRRQSILYGRAWPWRWFMAAHLVAFLAFAPLTAFVMEGGAKNSGHPELSVAVWTVWALVVGITWCAAAVPPVFWLPLLRRNAALLGLAVLLGVVGWTVSRSASELWQSFHEATFRLVRGLLSLSSADLICEPSEFLLGTTTFAVRIAPQCSGYEGMGLIAVFMSGYLFLFRRRLRFPAALLLLPIGVALMWLLNGVRIAVLVMIGTWGWPQVARGGFHSQAGWLAFNAVALGLVALSSRLRFLQAKGPTVGETRNGTAAYLAPFCAVLAVTMFTRAISDGFDWPYPLRVVAAIAVLLFYRRDYDCLHGGCSASALALGVLAFLLWIAWVPVATDGSGDKEMGMALTELPAGGALFWLVFRALGATIIVPVVEELAFRGYLLRRLVAADFENVDARNSSLFAVMTSSALFGLLHSNWLAGTAAGLIYALAFQRRGRLMDAIVAHATTNALLAAYVIAYGHWSMWG